MNPHPEQALTTYLVGGAVRDKLLGFKKADRDWVVVGSTPQKMRALGFLQVGKDFPVFLHPVTKEEYALARLERKTQPGHQGFEFQCSPHVTLEEDLQRRDLTINAIAMTQEGKLIDPYGGQEDIKNKVLRHVSSAFQEDPLRVLRVARFATRFHGLGFTIAPETLTLMQAMSQSGELKHLSAERLWREMSNSLSLDQPSWFMRTLEEVGALRSLVPEWTSLSSSHSEVMLKTLDISAHHHDSIELRFAAFMVGLCDSPQALEFYSAFCERFKPPTVFEKLGKLAIQYATKIMAPQDDAAQCLALLNAVDAYRSPERFNALQTVCLRFAESTGHTQTVTHIQKLGPLLRATQAVKAQPYLDQGLQGLAIKESMEAEKREILTGLLLPPLKG